METAPDPQDNSLPSRELLAAPSKQNGSKTDRYYWTQTLDEVSMYFPIDISIRSKFIKVKVDSNHLKITVTEGYVAYNLINKDFQEKVNINNDMWYWTIEEGEIEDYKGKYINFYIEKDISTKHWWKCSMKGDPCIDTSLCKKVEIIFSDLDSEVGTSGCRYLWGFSPYPKYLPQEDIKTKQEMLESFMKQHPEMDFSKCSFK